MQLVVSLASEATSSTESHKFTTVHCYPREYGPEVAQPTTDMSVRGITWG